MNSFDPNDFWEQSDYADSSRVDVPLTDELLAAIESELGYKLPTAYIELARTQNGGIPKGTCHRMTERTSWADDHVAITGIYAIGREMTYGLCGKIGSQFMIDEWGYPPIGVYFADCPSSGHDMLCLDYRECGVDGEPKVVHVDQAFDYKITLVANDFASFVEGLEPAERFDED